MIVMTKQIHTADKLQGTCSVCLRTIQLHGDRPIRHGFSAIGVRHGTHSGYHTGPCGGLNFPHLGISTEGTVWALGVARDRLVDTEKRLHELASNPDLVYYSKKYDSRGGRPDLANPITLRYGDEYDSMPLTAHPSYDYVHKQRVAELTNVKNELARAITAYEKVLATWKPQVAAAAPAKVETVHMAMPRKHTRFGEWQGITCRFTRSGYASDKLSKTTDPAKVTCKRCRAALGLPPL